MLEATGSSLRRLPDEQILARVSRFSRRWAIGISIVAAYTLAWGIACVVLGQTFGSGLAVIGAEAARSGVSVERVSELSAPAQEPPLPS